MTDGQSASLSWCQEPIWDPQPNFVLFFQLSSDSCEFGHVEHPLRPSGRVCSLQLLPGLASAVFLESESRETHDHILLSEI
jgi:hypothetical protein